VTDNVEAFWSWFDELRKDRSYRQVELAAGLSNGAISGRRNTELTPTADMCVTLAPVLGVPTVEVLTRAGFPVVNAPPDTTDPTLAELWALAQRLSPADRVVAVRVLRGLIS